MNILTRWYKDESGQALTEYGLIIAVIAIVVVAALIGFRNQIEDFFGRASKCIEKSDNAGTRTC